MHVELHALLSIFLHQNRHENTACLLTGNNQKEGKELKFYRKIRLSSTTEFLWPKETKFLFASSQETT